MIAFAAVGFGLAVVFPCLFSLAAKLVPNGKAAAMGYVGMVGGLPRITLPFLKGGWRRLTHWVPSLPPPLLSTLAMIIIVATFSKANTAVATLKPVTPTMVGMTGKK